MLNTQDHQFRQVTIRSTPRATVRLFTTT